VVLKALLGAREDVKEGRRPFDRKRALGDNGGLSTPFVPLAPLELPYVETLGEAILDELDISFSVRVGVYEVMEALGEILVCVENCSGDVVGEVVRCVEACGTGCCCGVAGTIVTAFGVADNV
jgi:hypothetical protein